MTIDSITGKIPITSRAAPKSFAATKTASRANDSDRIDTKTADRIKSALATASATPAVNSERIASIRQAISDGTYEVNAHRIAGKILQLEKNLPDLENSP